MATSPLRRKLGFRCHRIQLWVVSIVCCVLSVIAVGCQRGGDVHGGPAPDTSTHASTTTATAPPASEVPAVRSYTVMSGDTLWGISERFYGEGSQYRRIADANDVGNPDLIHPGQVLRIP